MVDENFGFGVSKMTHSRTSRMIKPNVLINSADTKRGRDIVEGIDAKDSKSSSLKHKYKAIHDNAS